jgi:hypothetical protein
MTFASIGLCYTCDKDEFPEKFFKLMKFVLLVRRTNYRYVMEIVFCSLQ